MSINFIYPPVHRCPTSPPSFKPPQKSSDLTSTLLSPFRYLAGICPYLKLHSLSHILAATDLSSPPSHMLHRSLAFYCLSLSSLPVYSYLRSLPNPPHRLQQPLFTSFPTTKSNGSAISHVSHPLDPQNPMDSRTPPQQM